MKKILFSFLFCGSIVAVSTLVESCYYDKESALYGPATTSTTCDTSTAKFATFVSPLITSGCASSSCHSATAKASGINLSSQATIKAYITSSKAAFIGSIKRTAGYSAMPKGGSKFADCDITKLEAWIAAGMQNN
jgi:cytochrome c553